MDNNRLKSEKLGQNSENGPRDPSSSRFMKKSASEEEELATGALEPDSEGRYEQKSAANSKPHSFRTEQRQFESKPNKKTLVGL